MLYTKLYFQIPTLFVEHMLQIHSKYSELIKDIFQNDQEFLSALDKACSTAINHKSSPKLPCRSPELVLIIFQQNINKKFDF